MKAQGYIMASAEENTRLDIKTKPELVERQALWAGISKGMRVADLGFGSGKTCSVLKKLVGPEGEVVGIDFDQDRIDFAKKYYQDNGILYHCRDIREPLEDIGKFDFIYIRFVLEYYGSESAKIVKNASNILKSNGILALIDLDHNCLSHFGLSEKLENTLFNIMAILQKNADFDPYAGRKLYSYLYDFGYEEIGMNLTPHHLIFGQLCDVDNFNWSKKAMIAVKNSGYDFEEYDGSFDAFYEDFINFFKDPRRFTYTPLISVRGKKPKLSY